MFKLSFGRIPVESSFFDTWDSLLPSAFNVGSFRLIGGAYVDNLYFFGKDASAAIMNANRVHNALKTNWELDIKLDSQIVLAPAGGDITECPEDWSFPDAVTFLGYIVERKGGIRRAWQHCRSKMWRCFFIITKAPGWTRLSVLWKCKVLERSIWSLLSFYCGSWPPQRQVAVEIDSTQRRMYVSIMKLRRKETESVVSFVRRRNKHAKKMCNDTGFWSSRWFNKATSWDAHLRRDLDQQRLHVEQEVPAALVSSCFSWGPALLAYQDEDFINSRRIVTRHDAISDCVVVRTGLRSGQRKVHPRWSSAISEFQARA